jgi:Ca2+:H+ antiporter
VPALFHYTERDLFAQQDPGPLDKRLSLGVSVVLIAVYVGNLLYTLVSHRDCFGLQDTRKPARWSLGKSLAVLVIATAATAAEAELVSDALEATAERLGMTTFFLGIIVLAIVGNAAEYVAAVYFARRDDLGLALGITVGSTIQVALLVAPLLVVISYAMGRPMDLVFANPLELIAVAAVAFIVNAIAQDGEATWFEGVLLLSVYVILGLAFFLVTP